MKKRTSTYLYVSTIFLITISCNLISKDTSTYFGGKIINPKSKYVFLHHISGKIADTFLLDNNNKFLAKINIAKNRMYYFKHGMEIQYIYLEPRDSLVLRLNTWDFDESLVFSGKGSGRNNMLIDCFLENEKENKILYSYSKLEPLLFRKKIDSFIKKKLEKYNNYLAIHPKETDRFKGFLKIALTSVIYSKTESYPLLYAARMKLDSFPKLDDSFYDYRKNMFVDDDSLIYYYAYSRYIKDYLHNLTYSLGYNPKDKYSLNFTNDLLHVISNKIDQEKVKNAFLKQTTINYFYRKSSHNIDDAVFQTFFKLNTNKKDITRVKNLLNDSKFLEKDKVINDFYITDYSNTKHSIRDVLKNKNTFLLFWSPKHLSKNYMAPRIEYLSSKYPTIQFLQIKIDGNLTERIPELDIKTQYFIDSISKANLFLTSKMPRVILINKQGVIKNKYAFFSSKKLHTQLENLNTQ